MVILRVVDGDLLSAKEKYIAHQCNCLTTTSHGIAKSIAKKFPYADVYKKRVAEGTRNRAIPRDRGEPGTVAYMRCRQKTLDDSSPTILCLFAQYSPGKWWRWRGFYPKDYTDNPENRRMWFKQCLDVLDADAEIDQVAVPYLIGCGLAGGDWKMYEEMLRNAITAFVLYRL